MKISGVVTRIERAIPRTSTLSAAGSSVRIVVEVRALNLDVNLEVVVREKHVDPNVRVGSSISLDLPFVGDLAKSSITVKGDTP